MKPHKPISPSEMINNFIGNTEKMATIQPRAEELPRLKNLNHVEWMYERIARSIIEFEERLDETEEVGARLVSFASNEVIAVEDLGYWGPDLIKFYGKNADGHKVELMQHTSQVNVLLVAMPVEGEKPNRIGFLLEQKLAKEDD